MAETVGTIKCTLAEGPLWDSRQHVLYWVDIIEGKIHSYDPGANAFKSYSAGKLVSCILPRQKGGFLIAREHAVYSWDPHKVPERMFSIDSEPSNNRFNDGKCDPAGRLWIGSMDMEEKSATGSLYMIGENLKIDRKVRGLTVSNGLAWSPDNTMMYHVDSPTRRVFRYRYDPGSGRISDREVFVEIPAGEGFPDGLTTDTEGNVYVAQWGGFCVSVWNSGGERISRISIPACNVSSCAFGGSDMKDLYVTTAAYGLSREQLKKEKFSGAIFRERSDIRGTEPDAFAG